MEELTVEQREQLAAYWWQRAQGEYTSWVGFQHVLADLRTEGSPAPVLELAERSVADERRHADFCRQWAIRFGHPGGELAARGEKPIVFRGATDGQNRLLRITYCCMNETVGCFVLRHVRPTLTVPELRELNRLHSEDEVQHSRVGWAHLATLRPAQREFLTPWVPALLRLVQTTWCEGTELEREDLVPFGYFSKRLLLAAHDEAVRAVIVPGFQHLGLAKVS